jgi:O-acetyl-ADP-ribose deacetylase (regulator of RNase III)
MAHFGGNLSIVPGDAVYPTGPGNKLIVHICNDIGHWGGGFTRPLTRRWLLPQMMYFDYHQIRNVEEPLELGTVMKCKVEDGIWVVNLIGMRGTRRSSVVPPIRYEAVRKGLLRVARMAGHHSATVHMPKIGCGLAGGEWERMRPIIERTLCQQGIDVTVYVLPDDDLLPVDRVEVEVETVEPGGGDY